MKKITYSEQLKLKLGKPKSNNISFFIFCPECFAFFKSLQSLQAEFGHAVKVLGEVFNTAG